MVMGEPLDFIPSLACRYIYICRDGGNVFISVSVKKKRKKEKESKTYINEERMKCTLVRVRTCVLISLI